MSEQICPRCAKVLVDIPLYKCVRCFTVYCQECNDSNEGRLCPQCQMSQRMIISAAKTK